MTMHKIVTVLAVIALSLGPLQGMHRTPGSKKRTNLSPKERSVHKSPQVKHFVKVMPTKPVKAKNPEDVYTKVEATQAFTKAAGDMLKKVRWDVSVRRNKSLRVVRRKKDKDELAKALKKIIKLEIRARDERENSPTAIVYTTSGFFLSLIMLVYASREESTLELLLENKLMTKRMRNNLCSCKDLMKLLKYLSAANALCMGSMTAYKAVTYLGR